MSKNFPGLGLGNPHRVRPKAEISRPENHVLKNSMSRFWWTPQCKQTPCGQKLRQLRTPYSVISGEHAVIGRIFQALPTQTDIVALINKIMIYLEKIV
jgi:hypothetical protein